MLQPTLATWILIIFGVVTIAPLVLAQLIMLAKPHSQKAKNFLVAKGADWRDKTHFRSALGCAWADWILFVPLMLFGGMGVILGQAWAYVPWGTAGAISLYINIVLWFMEREYVYSSRGLLAYYTY